LVEYAALRPDWETAFGEDGAYMCNAEAWGTEMLLESAVKLGARECSVNLRTDNQTFYGAFNRGWTSNILLNASIRRINDAAQGEADGIQPAAPPPPQPAVTFQRRPFETQGEQVEAQQMEGVEPEQTQPQHPVEEDEMGGTVGADEEMEEASRIDEGDDRRFTVALNDVFTLEEMLREPEGFVQNDIDLTSLQNVLHAMSSVPFDDTTPAKTEMAFVRRGAEEQEYAKLKEMHPYQRRYADIRGLYLDPFPEANDIPVNDLEEETVASNAFYNDLPLDGEVRLSATFLKTLERPN
ncbi:hypothetical protein JCM10213_005780, partial [Rhodosporidiobolus nylandii]